MHKERFFPLPEYHGLRPWMNGGAGRRPTRVDNRGPRILSVGAPVRFCFALLLAVSLLAQSHIFAEEKENREDWLIGTTFKTLAKAYVAIANIPSLKKINIDKLNAMSDEKFNEKYSKIYEALRDLPEELKSGFGITAHMTKQQALNTYESLSRKKMYELIDSVPDAFIAREFRKYLSKEKQDVQKSSIIEQVTRFWSKIVEKVNTVSVPAHSSK
jgi:hypothetical protein